MTLPPSEQRQLLREEALAARKEMPQPYRAHKSAVISDLLLTSFDLTLGITSTAVQDASVAVYQAFREEVDLHDFIEGLYNKGARVAFPCMVKDAHCCDDSQGAVIQTMEMRFVSHNQYKAGHITFLDNPLASFQHDAPELQAYPYAPAHDLTMLVVPVVAFDKQGTRLGYGGGNYDRYLTQMLPSCRITGVAFAEQEVEYIPREVHDVQIPLLIR